MVRDVVRILASRVSWKKTTSLQTKVENPKEPQCILFIENSIGLSGSTISLCNLVAHLNRELYIPYVVFSRNEQQEYFLNYFDPSVSTTVIQCRESLKFSRLSQRILSFIDNRFPLLKRSFFSLLSLFDVLFVIFPYTFRLYAFAREKNITLVHHNNGFDIAAIILAAVLGIPLIAYQRGNEWDSFLVRRLSKLVCSYIANSEVTKENLLSIGIPDDKIAVIYPPVDFTKFDYCIDSSAQRKEFNIRDDEPCFGIVGTLLEWKGHRVFLRAAKTVIHSVPGARAFIIGSVPDGNDTYRQELINLARDLGIADRVVFTGFRSDIPGLVQAMNVIVHTSITPEPFGRVIIEAMAMKKPVIASLAGGPIEIIRDQYNGFLVPVGDAEQLAGRIIQLLQDRALAERIGYNAYHNAKERFSIPSHMQMVQDIYTRVQRGT